MKRRLLQIVAVTSLLLFLATGVTWDRTYFYPSTVRVQDEVGSFSRITCTEGVIIVEGLYDADPKWKRPGPSWQRGVLGFEYGHRYFWERNHQWALGQIRWYSVPLWAPTLLFAMLFALAVWRLIRLRNWLDRASREGLCVNCAYDLRATPDRCPECGTVPQKSPVISD